jgi:hypothetical protein
VVRWIAIALALVVGVYQLRPSAEIRHPPGVIAAREPVQVDFAGARAFEHQGLQILPIATLDVEARVLSSERYWMSREGRLSPIDLALGWGPMSDQSVLDRINITQGGRFYYWWTARPPIASAEIARHSANMHLIPANDLVWRRLKSFRPGQVVRLQGYLVRATGPDGWRWESSLSRTDTGAGACELLWVEEAAATY